MMADEITLSVDLDLVNGNVEHDFRPNAILIDQANERYVDRIQDIGTSEETVSFGDLTAKGLVVLYNLDSSNYVNWGHTTGNLDCKILAGEYSVFRMDNSGALIMQANTATCKVRVILYDN